MNAQSEYTDEQLEIHGRIEHLLDHDNYVPEDGLPSVAEIKTEYDRLEQLAGAVLDLMEPEARELFGTYLAIQTSLRWLDYALADDWWQVDAYEGIHESAMAWHLSQLPAGTEDWGWAKASERKED